MSGPVNDPCLRRVILGGGSGFVFAGGAAPNLVETFWGPGWFWFLATTLIGAIVARLMYCDDFDPKDPEE